MGLSFQMSKQCNLHNRHSLSGVNVERDLETYLELCQTFMTEFSQENTRDEVSF